MWLSGGHARHGRIVMRMAHFRLSGGHARHGRIVVRTAHFRSLIHPLRTAQQDA